MTRFPPDRTAPAPPQVNPSFPLDVDRCLLLNATLGMKISCAGQCSARPDCRLFCADGECASGWPATPAGAEAMLKGARREA